MPVFNFFHWTNDRGVYLQETGPIIPVTVAVPKAMQEHLSS